MIIKYSLIEINCKTVFLALRVREIRGSDGISWSVILLTLCVKKQWILSVNTLSTYSYMYLMTFDDMCISGEEHYMHACLRRMSRSWETKPQKIIRKDIFYVSGANSLLRQFSVKKSLIFMENSCSQAMVPRTLISLAGPWRLEGRIMDDWLWNLTPDPDPIPDPLSLIER